jgi:hypothetical protein
MLELELMPLTGPRVCGWCRGPIPPRRRGDAKWCSKVCRQAAHRAKVEPVGRARGTTVARLAYADPPYIGMAARYYRGHPDYAGEVDHRQLLDRLATYDGWALSCSSSSVGYLFGLVATLDIKPRPRLAIWHRLPKPHRTAGLVTAFEGVLFVSARSVERGSDGPIADVLLGVESRARPTLPTDVIGRKPPAFCAWIFALMGARPGDELDDLYPGSGLVARAWSQWSRPRRATLLDP